MINGVDPGINGGMYLGESYYYYYYYASRLRSTSGYDFTGYSRQDTSLFRVA